jgi:hypothetical protein
MLSGAGNLEVNTAGHVGVDLCGLHLPRIFTSAHGKRDGARVSQVSLGVDLIGDAMQGGESGSVVVKSEREGGRGGFVNYSSTI